MLSEPQQPLPIVVQQHVEEAAILRSVRSVLVRAADVNLRDLGRLDERIAAHLDGVAIAGDYASRLCSAALERPRTGEVFTAAVRALDEKNERQLAALFALVGAVPEAQSGLRSAFGWVAASQLRGTVATLLASAESLDRLVGIAACAMHDVDPGTPLLHAFNDPDPQLRARAFRAAGDLGRHDLLLACDSGCDDEDREVRFCAARSAIFLGRTKKGIRTLETFAATADSFQSPALCILVKTIGLPAAHELLKGIAQKSASKRLLIEGAGAAGDAQYLPWLIGQMSDPALARVAGESFSTITGIDFAELNLNKDAPDDFEAGPTDEAEEDDVAMDRDDGLVWPDQERVQQWWNSNQQRFRSGTRHFMGAIPTREHCFGVLKEGYQRQRSVGAEYLCLLRPGTPLFNVCAPAWRQKQLLQKMS